MSVQPWPGRKIVLAALRGTRLVFKSEAGLTVGGFKSARPWVFWAPAGAVCERCSTVSPSPAPPGGQNDVPLFEKTTDAYATYLLAFLHKFYATHDKCKKGKKS